MKSKFTKVPHPETEQEDNEEGSEVEAGGPAIASAKKNRIIILVLISVLVTVVVYFVFLKGAFEPKVEKLQEVPVPPSRNVASSETRPLFEPEIPNPSAKTKEETDLLEKPAVPEIPSLPETATIAPEIVVPPEAAQPVANGQQPGQQLLPNLNTQNPQQQAVQTKVETEKKEAEPKEANPRYAPIVVFSGGAENAPTLGVGYEKNIVDLNDDPIKKLEKSKVSVKTTRVSDRTHSITQGKLLTAVLETAINTEIPGSVRGIISRDVYGESGNEVLIPKGSRLYGSYSSKVLKGQGRVDISWSRLIRPDGVDMAISFNASDQFGRSGIEGDVNNKYGTVVAGSLLTSVLAVGSAAVMGKILGNNGSVSTTTSNGSTTTTGSAANQAVADVTKTIIDTAGTIVGNSIDITPVIRVPQGTKITVIVNADMNLPSLDRH